MARNGSGVYSLPAGSSVTNGDISDASDLNTPFSDLEADMNIARPVVAGGTGATTAAAARTNLGVSAAADVLAKANNLSDVANAATARTNLGLQIGVDVQAWDADLDAWAFKTAPTGAVIGATDTQTLSNKTIASPIISAPTLNGVVSGNSLALQSEAEAGTNNDQLMTPLRTAEAIAALGTPAPSTTLGDVGTYAILYEFTANTTPITEGDTRAGSGLRYNSAYYNGAFGGTIQAGAAAADGGTPSGTWRLMGVSTSTANVRKGGIWLRIS